MAISSDAQATVRRGRPSERDGVIAFPRDRAFGAAVGQKRWLRARAERLFRPLGFLAWGVSDPPPHPPASCTAPPPAFSWCNRFTIAGRDELVMVGGFGLHYFRVPRTFEQLIETLSMPTGERLSGPFEDSFCGVVAPGASLPKLFMIPKHCELDFRTAAVGDELAIEVSGPVDRVVAWGKVVVS